MSLIRTQTTIPPGNPWSGNPRLLSSWYSAGAHWPAALLLRALAGESMKLRAKAPLVLTRKLTRNLSRTLPPLRLLSTWNSRCLTFGRMFAVELAQFTAPKALLFSALACPAFDESTSPFPCLSLCFRAWPHRRNLVLRKRLCIRCGKSPIGTGDAWVLIPLAFRLFKRFTWQYWTHRWVRPKYRLRRLEWFF